MVEEDGFAFLRKSHGPANVPPARPLGRPFRTHPQIENEQPPAGVTHFLVEEDGFEPSKAKPADLQSVPFGHLGPPPYSVGRKKGGAGGRIRTPDLLITNQLLYRLSYTSTEAFRATAELIITAGNGLVNHFSKRILKDEEMAPHAAMES